jgi:NADH-quinone oxidoreductase subunit L
MFTPDVMMVVAIVGAVTLVLSAATATVQNDIKRVLAFSTCSQLGYMMMALGLAGWTAGLFHLITHAYFKALLFLGAGSVIHALHHEQDLRKMGGLRKKLPITSITMFVGVLAIIGVPLFSGWYSKDAILAYTLHHWPFAVAAFGTVILTAYYMTRLWLLAFAGPPRDRHVHEHAHESPAVMTVPLVLLAAAAIGIAWGWPIWDADASLLGKELHRAEPGMKEIAKAAEAAHHEHLLAEILGLACAAVGVLIALTRFSANKLIVLKPTPLSRTLEERFYFDPIYDALGTKPVLAAARTFANLDRNEKNAASLDGVLTGMAASTNTLGNKLSALQPGALRGYILALGLTVAGSLAILWVVVR